MFYPSFAPLGSLLLLLVSHADAKASAPGTLMRGWTSWDLSAVTGSSVYGREWMNAERILEQSAALAASGMQEQGFLYINVDSFWAADPTQMVDEWGRWIPNATRFPSGIRAVADAVHARGQKFGIYLNPGVAVAAVKQATPVEGTNCSALDIAAHPYVGGNVFWDTYKINYSSSCATAYIQSFANLLALDWTVDFLKLDAVSPGSDNNNASQYDSREDVAAWSAALEATGRDVWLTISWAIDPTFAVDFSPHANAWRTSDDVDCYCNTLVEWSSILRLFSQVRPWVNYTGWGAALGLPDPDSLNVGQGELDGLTIDEKISYATLWAIICAPRYTGNDLTVLDSYGKMLLAGNSDVLAINAALVPARPTLASSNSSGPQVWVTDYANGTYVVALFNLGDSPAPVTATFSDFIAPGATSFNLSDVWFGWQFGVWEHEFTTGTLAAHGVQLVRMVAVATPGTV